MLATECSSKIPCKWRSLSITVDEPSYELPSFGNLIAIYVKMVASSKRELRSTGDFDGDSCTTERRS